MEPKTLEVGLLLWWKGESKAQPIMITYVNHKKNCFRFITFSNNVETDNLHIMREDKPTHLLEEMSKTDKVKVCEYLSQRKKDAQNKISTTLSELHEAQHRHDLAVQTMHLEFVLDEDIKKTIKKFEGYLSKSE